MTHDVCCVMNDDDLLSLVTSTLGDRDTTTPPGYRLVARGEVDLVTAHRLEAAFDALIEADAKVIVLDASDVTFIDSSGLRVIVNSSDKLSANDGRLLIEGMSGAVQRVLEVTGLIERYRA